MLTYIRLPRVPRAVVARRLALSGACGAALAVAALAPTHQASASGVAAAESPAQAQQAADPGTAAPAHTTRTNAPAHGDARIVSGIPVRDVSPPEPPATAQPAPSAAPAKAPAPAPAPKRTRPSLPAIPGLDIYQRENARTIVDVGREMGVDERGQIIAVATALQESRLYNLYVAVDHDSLGLFQQRPSTGWGTPAEITTPSYAARAFYTRLLDTTSDWGCLTCAAQRVQGSAFPYAYAAHEWEATNIVGAFYRH